MSGGNHTIYVGERSENLPLRANDNRSRGRNPRAERLPGTHPPQGS
jgi:hypothetical protein